MWIRVLGGERLPGVSYALRRNLKRTDLMCAIKEGSTIIVVLCFLHSSGGMLFYQTPGRRPPHITGFAVKAVNLTWVRAPNGRVALRFHSQSLSRM